MSTTQDKANNTPAPWINILSQPDINISIDPLISGYPTVTSYTATAGNTNFKLLKAGPSLLGMMIVSNNSTSMKILNLYDKGTAPASTDTAFMSIPVSANVNMSIPIPNGLRFANGIGIGISNGAGLLNFITGLLTIVAGDLTINFIYI